MLILNRSETSRALPHGDCIRALRPAMISVSRGEAELPLRKYLQIPGTQGKFTLMPGYSANPATFGVKIVSKFPRGPDSPHSSHVGAVMVFDPAEGLPLALLDGAELTAIRTASASAVATDALAREDARTLGIMGCGEEAWHHAQAIPEVRPIDRILIWGRNADRANALAERVSSATMINAEAELDAPSLAAKSDVLCTVTSATTPILQGKWLQPGIHINLVGAAIASAAEADQDVVTRSSFFTDYRPSAMDQAGELLNAIESGAVTAEHVRAEIGEVLDGIADGRSNEDEITVYKSLGVAAQDLAAGLAAYQRAVGQGIGVQVDW